MYRISDKHNFIITKNTVCTIINLGLYIFSESATAHFHSVASINALEK